MFNVYCKALKIVSICFRQRIVMAPRLFFLTVLYFDIWSILQGWVLALTRRVRVDFRWTYRWSGRLLIKLLACLLALSTTFLYFDCFPPPLVAVASPFPKRQQGTPGILLPSFWSFALMPIRVLCVHYHALSSLRFTRRQGRFAALQIVLGELELFVGFVCSLIATWGLRGFPPQVP